MSTADPDAVRQRRHAEAADAWVRGRKALNAGDLATALFWLERVGRIAPQDPRAAFERALTLAAIQDPAAEPALHAIATAHDLAGAWLALARVRWRAHDRSGAATALATLFQRHELPDDPDLAAFAAAVAEAAGAPGWCAIADGALALHAATPTIRADGVECPGLPRKLAHISTLQIEAAGIPLLGSTLNLATLRRTGGIAHAERGGITGWVTHPAAPDRAPKLELIDRHGTSRAIHPRRRLPPDAPAWFLPRHAFRIGAKVLQGLQPPFRIVTPDGTLLHGTPLDPAMLTDLAPFRARSRPRTKPATAGLCAVMPVYRNAAATLAALRSLYAALGPKRVGTVPIVVVDDASPEPDLVRMIDAEHQVGRIHLRRHRHNRGFPGAANAGISAARRLLPGCDILLLNADILIPPGAPARLQAALYASDAIASATPLSNEATILSYPAPQGGNPPPDLAATIRLDRLARRANPAGIVEIPTAIGFCMAIRHDALDATGRFDQRLFAQGYGEENDWCRRAAALGFRHVGVPGVYVAHHANTSFGAAASSLCARNLTILERRHPGYHALIAAHHADDPLQPARFRLDRARFQSATSGTGAVVLVSHDHGGGIARVIAARMASLRAAGLRPILIQPDFSDPASRASFIGTARLTDDAPQDYPNLCYAMPDRFAALVALLRRETVRHVEFHHTLGHHPIIRDLATALDVPAEHIIHDYASFCKRVNLIGPARRYCGEPDVAGCDACIAAAGSELTDPISPAALVTRSRAEFRAARRISVPSADVQARLQRHFPGIKPTITPWEDDTAPLALRAPPTAGARLIAVVGGIGPAKGFDVLLDCARDAASNNLPLRFVLIGTSEDDAALIATGRVLITGAYQEGEAAGLIARSGAQLGFLPSIWPETWCFALSEAWRGGLYVVGFDLGAPAARIKATGRGFLLPLGLPTARINQTLLAWRPNLGNLNNRIQPLMSSAPAPTPADANQPS
ncbi:MAG: glycosyl transferase [Acidiphilium sp. 37-64-53]|uniref:glycosyltransferase n=1 Tax=Acidiphilium TaxID=522 RepID=UPI000BCF7B2F|nr:MULTISPECIES: glycosyltransferase [Acidiphilium]OYW02385.1 MAG: glycosyl transferase [Acidiphilium sp. 37-64-53]OZB30188.1 MAG: glycosyl transferase [Acidiphilium sp. 34-64-41]HQT84526.1 glycosyltransferase [Acidiphilium rubrum]